MSSFFAASGGSPPRFDQRPPSSARIGVPHPHLQRISSGDRILQQIRSFNFKSVPNSERIRVPAAWCICTTAISATCTRAGADSREIQNESL